MLGALTFAIVPSCSNNKMFETFSYLPPLSDDQIARQVDYIVNNGWTPCLEFSEPELAYVQSTSTDRMGAVSSVSESLSAQAIFSSMALAEASVLPGSCNSISASCTFLYARQLHWSSRHVLTTVTCFFVCRTTSTTGTGQCGSCPCSAAQTPCRSVPIALDCSHNSRRVIATCFLPVINAASILSARKPAACHAEYPQYCSAVHQQFCN